MSSSTFILALAAGAALLALWIHIRFPSLAPGRLGWTVGHCVAAFVLLQLGSGFVGSTPALVGVFLFVLPALTYALLCSIWMIVHAQATLNLSR